MNVREEDRQKNSCPSRGLGIAAAAIGVGVGAALYYFFSKRPENPDAGGSTTQWSCEQPHTFHQLHDNEDSEYTTVSENTTTDTSMFTSDESDSQTNESSYEESSEEESDDMYPDWFCDCSSDDSDDSLIDLTGDTHNSSFLNRVNINSSLDFDNVVGGLNYPTINTSNVESDPDTMDWDVTDSSAGVPDGGMFVPSPLRSLFNNIEAYIVPIPQRRPQITEAERRRIMLRDQALAEEEQLKILRDQAFRERTWSLEECSICFDVILKDQEVTTLPCTHHFHSECITPWLQEQQTCPNCRKAAE